MRASEPKQWLMVGAILVLFAALAFLCGRGDTPFTTDSLRYVEVARNIASGAGVATRVLSLDHAGPGLRPYTLQPPAYPLLIAALSRAGVDAATGALALSFLGALALLLLLFLLARRIVAAVAPLVVLVSALSYPFYEVANHALTETLFVATLLAVLLLGTHERGIPFPGRPRIAFPAGLLSGVLLALRYTGAPTLLLLSAVALYPLLVAPERRRESATGAAVWALGVTAVALPLLVFVVTADATLVTGPAPRLGLLGNLLANVAYVGNHMVLTIPGIAHRFRLYVPIGAALLLGGPFLFFRWRRVLASKAKRLDPATDSLLLFTAAYPIVHLGWIVVMRSIMHFNSWASRHLFPMYPFLILNAVAFFYLWSRSRARGRRSAPIVIGSALWLIALIGNTQLVVTDARRPVPPMDLGGAPEWILANTRPGDTLVAIEAEVLASAVPERRFVALDRWPYSVRNLRMGDLPRLRDTLGVRFIVLLEARAELMFKGGYGPFLPAVVDSVGGGGLTFIAEVPGAVVFEIDR